jgi:hypothetical protein
MRLSNNYIRPEITKQDIISNDPYKLQKCLQNYIQIHEDNYQDIDTGIWIKYINDENKYRSGGVLIYNKAPEYFVLKNPFNNISWSVKLNKNIVFMRDIGEQRREMIEKNNLYRLYEKGFIKILDEPDIDLIKRED